MPVGRVLAAPFWGLWLLWAPIVAGARAAVAEAKSGWREWSGQYHEFDGRQIRVLLEGDDIWFVAADVFDVLETPRKARDPERVRQIVGRDGLRPAPGTDLLSFSEKGLAAWFDRRTDRTASLFARWIETQVVQPYRRRRELEHQATSRHPMAPSETIVRAGRSARARDNRGFALALDRMSPLSRLFSQNRIKVSRIFGFAFVAALLATGSVWQGTWVGRAMFLAGIVLAAIGMVGRIWCLVYSSGYKSSELVTQGPYSVCRNPLYFFSFIGLIGIGLSTETFTLTLFLVAFFALVYPAVIAGEEEFLRGKFGDAYAEYCRRVPRFFPARRLFVEPESYTVQPRTLRRSLGGVIWFIGLPVVIQILVMLRTAGVIGSVTLLP